MSSEQKNNHTLKNRYATLLQDLERHKGTERLLIRVLTRLTIAASGLNSKLDPLLSQMLGLLRKGESMVLIQTDLEQASEILFRNAMDELEKKKTDADPAIPPPTPVADSLSTPDSRYRTLFGFLKSRLQSSEEIEALQSLELRVQKGESIEEWVLFDELESLLDAILSARPQAAENRKAGASGLLSRLFANNKNIDGAIDLGAIQKNLLALLASVEVPLALQGKANKLNAKLRNELDADGLMTVFQETIAFLAHIKISAQHEQKFLEEFLNELTGKLTELEQHALGIDELNRATEVGAEEMHASFSEHLENLKSSAADATDIGSLKALLSQRVDVIASYLSVKREEEKQRLREAEQKMAQLTSRLHHLEEDTQELHSKLLLQHNLSMRDPLTGLPNRLAYDERINQEVMRFKRFATPFCLLVWDIDHFKSINDRFGHKAGDRALMTIAGMLSDNIRETDFVGRFGGEEFVMILAGTHKADAWRVANGIREKVEHCGFNTHGKPVTITISCGIGEYKKDESQDHTFERADQALYRAKNEGRNRCVVAD